MIEINKELIDNCADFLIKQRNFNKEGNVLLLPISIKKDLSDEIVEYAHKRGIYFKFDIRTPTLLPFGDADSYTLKAGYIDPKKNSAIFLKYDPWWKRLWKAVTSRSRHKIYFPKEGLK